MSKASDRFLAEAVDAVRRKVRERCLDVVAEPNTTAGQLQAIEAAVMKAVLDKEIAWALAYLAGVRMAPDVISRLQIPAPQPPTVGAAGSKGR